MTHNKQDHQKKTVYIFIQICRVFVSNFFTALLRSPLPCNESCSICTHTWQKKWLCIEGKLNAKQIERISPAINLLRAELLYLAGILCQPLGHLWYYDFLSSCKQGVLLNGYSGLEAELELSGTGSTGGSASWGTQKAFFFWAVTSSDSRQSHCRAFKKDAKLYISYFSYPSMNALARFQMRDSTGAAHSALLSLLEWPHWREGAKWVLVFHIFPAKYLPREPQPPYLVQVMCMAAHALIITGESTEAGRVRERLEWLHPTMLLPLFPCVREEA